MHIMATTSRIYKPCFAKISETEIMNLVRNGNGTPNPRSIGAICGIIPLIRPIVIRRANIPIIIG
jgi:hypothetical protein